jgi:predicted ATP-grasp superfamily ATP-dependent carboligase
MTRTAPNTAPAPAHAPAVRPRWERGRAAGLAAGEGLDAVILDAELRQALVAVQQLGRSGLRIGVVECASTPSVPAFASRYAATRAVVPDRETVPDDMIDSLLDLLQQHSARVVIPTHDGTIEALTARRVDFERTCAVTLASPDALRTAVDKNATLKIASGLGLRIPHCVPVHRDDDVAAAVGQIGLPAVVKPTRSWVVDGQSAHRLSPVAVVSLAEACAAVQQLRTAGADVLVQEWIPGAREAVSFVYAHDRFYGEFAQLATRMVPILGGNSVMRESIPVPRDAADGARQLVRAIGLEGYAEVEFRRDRAGTPVLMEINPRLSASVEVAVRAGVDFPNLLYAWALGEKLERSVGYRTGVRMRWLGGDIRWLVDTVRAQGRPDAFTRGRAVWSFVRDFTRRTGYDFVERDDLRPAAVASRAALGLTARNVTRKLARRHTTQ